MKKCIIVANSDFSGFHPGFAADFVIGADKFIAGMDLLVGDFDSLAAPPDNIEIIRHPAEKDESDLELAVNEAIRRGFSCFYIYGALGGRLDHTLASIAVLTSIAKKGMTGWLIGENELITAITDEQLTIDNGQLTVGELISLFPAGETARGVTLTNLKYPLCDAVLSCDNSLGLSNEFIGEKATIEVKDGTLIIILPKTLDNPK